MTITMLPATWMLTADVPAEISATAEDAPCFPSGYAPTVMQAGELLRALCDQGIDPFIADLAEDEEDARQWAGETSRDGGATWRAVRWCGPAEMQAA